MDYTQLDKINMKMSKNSKSDVAKANYDVRLILAIPTYFQFSKFYL